MPPLTADEIVILRDALTALRRQRETVTTFASRFLQGSAQTQLLVKAGGQLQDIELLNRRLREEHARLTGQPAIQHGNTDLHDPAATEPMSPADEAREANVRG